jgi:hypothetical protein
MYFVTVGRGASGFLFSRSPVFDGVGAGRYLVTVGAGFGFESSEESDEVSEETPV